MTKKISQIRPSEAPAEDVRRKITHPRRKKALSIKNRMKNAREHRAAKRIDPLVSDIRVKLDQVS